MSFDPPKGYREQNGCWNCRWCLDQSCQDGESLLCIFGKGSPPRRDAFPAKDGFDAWTKQIEEFCDWELDNQVPSVKRNGICGEWGERR